MSNSTDHITQIVSLLEGVQVSASAGLKDVLTYATNTFPNGYPSATIVGPEIQSAYDSVVQNLRTYIYTVEVYVDLAEQDDTTAYSSMRQLIDGILDALDQSLDLAGTADFVNPTVEQPYAEAVTAGGKCLIGTVRIEVRKTITIKSS